MRVLVIPDVHLKSWIFDKAEDALSTGKYDKVISLGDIVDDWNKQFEQDLYVETLNKLLAFAEDHRNNFLFCWGNHDISYFWKAYETGYSWVMEYVITQKFEELKEILPKDQIAFIHRLDNVLFCHGGLTDYYIREYFHKNSENIDKILITINTRHKQDKLWSDASPLWARPQSGSIPLYPADLLQVVGHTPVKRATKQGNLLSVDTFSTYADGTPIGDSCLVWVDTITKEWGTV